MASTSSASAAPSPTILLFARGVVAILELWPALSIAVSEQWGGVESADKRTWMASTIIDEWEQRTSYLPQAPNSPLVVDPADAKDLPLDQDDLGDLLNQMISDEFEVSIEDGSVDSIANDIIRLWQELFTPGTAAEQAVTVLEQRAASRQKSGVSVSKGGDLEEVDGDDDDEDDDDDDDDEMDVDEAPQLVAREPKEKQEPVVDDDGFTLVQGKGGRRR